MLLSLGSGDVATLHLLVWSLSGMKRGAHMGLRCAWYDLLLAKLLHTTERLAVLSRNTKFTMCHTAFWPNQTVPF